MINIAELLKNAPKGMSLYSTLFGNVELSEVRIGDDMPIRITRGYAVELFDKYGRYYKGFPDAECLLFPSKDCRTWQGWTPCVEPQYKVHDCVVSNGQPAIIYELKKDYYLGKYLNGHDFCHKYADEDKLHLWTIQDAEDGDMLATDNIICIFRKLDKDGYYIISPCIYTVKDGLEIISDENDTIGSCGFKPATKEDRELLFRKMKEAGYEWDENKKELRKIQHYNISNFKPKQWVLVRDDDEWEWALTRFSYLSNGSASLFVCINGASFQQCIPFEGNEHLLGTTDPCDEQYINW